MDSKEEEDPSILVTELLRISEPLAHEIGNPDVDEDGSRLLGDGLGEHGLPGARRAVEEHPLLRAEELPVREEIRAAQGQDDEVVERLLDVVEPADGVELDVDMVGVDDVARNDVLKEGTGWVGTLGGRIRIGEEGTRTSYGVVETSGLPSRLEISFFCCCAFWDAARLGSRWWSPAKRTRQLSAALAA
jgi:hypothetical protein